MQFLLNWLEARREAKYQARFESGFSCVMMMYFHQELPLEYIADSGYQLSSATKRDPWDEGYVEAIDRINMLEQKLNGPLYADANVENEIGYQEYLAKQKELRNANHQS